MRLVRVLLDDDCCLTITDLRSEMVVRFMHEIHRGAVEHALKELEMHKVCAHWVPRELVPEMREEQVVAVRKLSSIILKNMKYRTAGAGRLVMNRGFITGLIKQKGQRFSLENGGIVVEKVVVSKISIRIDKVLDLDTTGCQ